MPSGSARRSRRRRAATSARSAASLALAAGRARGRAQPGAGAPAGLDASRAAPDRRARSVAQARSRGAQRGRAARSGGLRRPAGDRLRPCRSRRRAGGSPIMSGSAKAAMIVGRTERSGRRGWRRRRPRSADRAARPPRRAGLAGASARDGAAEEGGPVLLLIGAQPLRRDQRRVRPARPATPCCRRRRGGSSGMVGAEARARAGRADGRRRIRGRCSPRRRRLDEGRVRSPASWSRRSARPVRRRATMSSTLAAGSASPPREAGRRCRGACCAGPAPRWPRRRRATAGRGPRARRRRRGGERARATGWRSTCARALDRDEIEMLLPAAGFDRRPARSSASRRWPAGAIREFGELGAVTLFAVAERSDYLAPAVRPCPAQGDRRGGGLAGGAGATCGWR